VACFECEAKVPGSNILAHAWPSVDEIFVHQISVFQAARGEGDGLRMTPASEIEAPL
jgi:hypothetical protein